MEPQAITLALIDHSAGFEAAPERVRLSELARFADDVQTFLRGTAGEVDTRQLDVSVQKGSLAIVTAPLAGAPRLFHDLQALLASELLDSVDTKRQEVVARWQKAARASKDVAYRITAPFLNQPITVRADTDYRADDADQWVQVERYIRGEVQNMGGSTKANAHVRLFDGSTLMVTTEKGLLRDDTVNRLYKTAMLRVKAEYNVRTRGLRNARLIEFVAHSSSVDEDELARLARRGALAWKDVTDATAWVDDLRGGGR